MTEKTYTGSELKAWRERLGLSMVEAAVLAAKHSDCLWGTNVIAWCEMAEDSEREGSRSEYAAALAAEEARRAPAEPVPPEGVTVKHYTDPSYSEVFSDDVLVASVWSDDALAIRIEDEIASPEALEYVVALSRYRAAQHTAAEAEAEREKIDAVKAAEEALKDADKAYDDAWQGRQEALSALAAARKEAGLS